MCAGHFRMKGSQTDESRFRQNGLNEGSAGAPFGIVDNDGWPAWYRGYSREGWASTVPRRLTTLFLFLKHNRNGFGGVELGTRVGMAGGVRVPGGVRLHWGKVKKSSDTSLPWALTGPPRHWC